MVEEILKFLAPNYQQNDFPRLKGYNQDYISWRGIINKLEKKWLGEQCPWNPPPRFRLHR